MYVTGFWFRRMVTLEMTEHCHIPAGFILLNRKPEGTHGRSEHIGKGKKV
jgi:hypothetical protein